jgi:hypothetical protein
VRFTPFSPTKKQIRLVMSMKFREPILGTLNGYSVDRVTRSPNSEILFSFIMGADELSASEILTQPASSAGIGDRVVDSSIVG